MGGQDISVIIPTHNSGRLLPACLKAALANKCVREIVVVDDASTDDTEKILNGFPVKTVRLNENKGPVAARNAGAREASGKYLLFLDSDILLAPDYVSTLASFLERQLDAAGVSGKITDTAGNQIPYNFGRRFSLFSLLEDTLFRRIPRKRSPEHYRARKVGWVIESAFMTPRKIFEALGGFDEGFFMFHEGPDYSERARYLGHETWHLPQAHATHLDLKSRPSDRKKIIRKSTMHYLRKHRIRLW